MALHNFAAIRGTRVEFTIDSKALRNNLLGDPTTRRVAVYLPEGYDDSTGDYPLFVDLVGFTGSGLAHFNWRPFGDNIPQRIDRLIDEGKMGPVVTVFPDCFTSLGGNQYIDSAAMGNWEDFLIDEMIPAVEARFRVRKGREHRAIFGKSSGGYGAIVHGLRRAEAWGAVACHSGDMGFLMGYSGDFPKVLDTLAGYDRDIGRLLAHYEAKPKLSHDDMHNLMTLAMAATYDPDPSQPKGVRLPVDHYTGEMIPERWANWMAHDPVAFTWCTAHGPWSPCCKRQASTTGTRSSTTTTPRSTTARTSRSPSYTTPSPDSDTMPPSLPPPGAGEMPRRGREGGGRRTAEPSCGENDPGPHGRPGGEGVTAGAVGTGALPLCYPGRAGPPRRGS